MTYVVGSCAVMTTFFALWSGLVAELCFGPTWTWHGVAVGTVLGVAASVRMFTRP